MAMVNTTPLKAINFTGRRADAAMTNGEGLFFAAIDAGDRPLQNGELQVLPSDRQFIAR